ncbi:MAG TPA: hypothetical protein EYN79_10540 [Planctomycetes bacterium]|nr:hypothetical protein [Planctomycetota bacterium]
MRERSLTTITSLCGSGSSRRAHGRSARGAQIDSRLIGEGDLFFALEGSSCHGIDHLPEAFRRGAVAVFCEARHLRQFEGAAIVVDDPVAALGRLAAAIRKEESRDLPAIAVTGSHGKTTTCQFAGELLAAVVPTAIPRASHNNHLGVPLTILNAPPESEVLVCEVGSNAPGEVEPLGRWIAPRSAVVTSIGPSHLAGFGDLDAVAREKFSLLTTIEEGGVAWVPVEVRGHLLAPEMETLTFGVDGDLELVREGETSWRLEDRKRRRRMPFTWQPTTTWAPRCLEAALAVALEVIDAPEEMLAVCSSLSLPPLRGEVLSVEGVELVLDCYNASPFTLNAAITDLMSCHARRRFAVVGTMEELGREEARWHFEAGEKLAEVGLDGIFLHGRGGPWLLEGIEAMGGTAELLDGDGGRASETVVDRLARGDRILFKASRNEQLELLASRVADGLREKGS